MSVETPSGELPVDVARVVGEASDAIPRANSSSDAYDQLPEIAKKHGVDYEVWGYRIRGALGPAFALKLLQDQSKES